MRTRNAQDRLVLPKFHGWILESRLLKARYLVVVVRPHHVVFIMVGKRNYMADLPLFFLLLVVLVVVMIWSEWGTHLFL